MNRATDKLSRLASSVYVARSGAAADTQRVTSYIQAYLGLHESELNEPPSVKTAAHLIHQQMYRNKDHLRGGLIVAGWDRHEGGAVYSVPMGGTMIRVPFAIGGSGSSYIYGWCDKHWKENMTREECQAFVRTAVTHAIARDGASGGGIRTVTVDESGPESSFLPGENIPLVAGDLAPSVLA